MTIAGAINFPGATPDMSRCLRAMALGLSKPRLHREDGAIFGICDEAELASDGEIVGQFHGRLDNAADLDLPRAGLSNAEILLYAYRRWGTDFPERLVGDFACSVWDSASHRLLLVRDALGAQPLHFWRNGDEVLFATEPQGILAYAQVPRRIDERWIARWLALLPHEGSSTLYCDIERVMPGCVAIFDKNGARQARYWRPEELPPIRLPKDEDYAEALSKLLGQAIRCRIADADVVGSHLSSGLDSSSVTALAARHLGEMGRRLTAFTAVPSAKFEGVAGRDEIWDEGPLGRLVAGAFSNIDHVVTPNEGPAVFDVLDHVAATAGLPVMNPMNQGWVEAIGREAKKRRVTVMLTGGMGNMSISYDGFGFLTALVRRGRFVTLAKHLLALRRNGERWSFLGNRVIGPALPAPIRKGLRQFFGRPEETLEQFSSLRGAFAQRLGILDEAMSMSGNVGNNALGRQEIRLAVIGRIDRAMMLRGERRRHGYTVCDPTADRRLVEFCLAIPPEQFLVGGQRRSLIRRAMKGVLPDAVRLERRRGLQAADWARQVISSRVEISAEIDRLERSPLAAACLDLPRLRKLVDKWPKEDWSGRKITLSYRLALMRGLATGRFLRRFEGGNE